MATFHWDLDAAGAASGDETSVTSGNGGAAGPTSVNGVTGGTRVYDDDQSPPGYTWAVRLATGATSGVSNMVWGSARIADPAVAYFRIPFRFSDLSASRSIIRIRNGSTQILRVHTNSSGRLELRNTGNSVAASGSVTMPTDQWIEIGAFADPGNTSTCRLRWWLWGADATDYEDEVSATDNFSTATTVNELTVGNAANGIDIPNYWVGRVRYSDSGWPGPLVVVHDGSVSLPGVGALSGSGTPVRAATTALPGTGALSSTAAVVRVGTSALSGVGVLAASGSVTRAGAAGLAGTTNLTATGSGDLQATAALPGAGGLAAAAVVASPLGSLVDDFEDGTADTAKWPGNYGGIAETGGRLRIDCDVSQWSGLKSATGYFLAGSQVLLRAYPAAANTATVAYLSALVTTTTAGTDAGFNIDTASNGIAFLNRVGFSDPDAVFDTYSPTDHAWLRLSESGGTLTWETSPDGQTWTVRRTDDSPAWVADEDLALLCEAHRDAGTDNFAEVDSVNVAPSASHDADADLQAVATLSAEAYAVRGASAGLSGVGSLAATATPERAATATLTAAGAVAASAVPVRLAEGGLAAGTQLGGTATATVAGAVTLPAQGALAGSAVATRAATADLAGTAQLSAAATTGVDAAADLPAGGSLTATSAVSRPAAAGLAGTGSLQAAASVAGDAALAGLTGAGVFAAAGQVARAAAAGLPVAGTLTASGAAARTAAAALVGVGSLATSAVAVRAGAAVLSGAGALAAVGDVLSSVIYHPDVGVITRPSVGTVGRPDTGTIERPNTGTITRPDVGLILQP